MYCRKCGTEIPDDSVCCVKCGTPVESAVGKTQKAEQSTESVKEKSISDKAPKKKKGLAKLFSNVQKAVGVKPKTQQQVKAEVKKQQKNMTY